MLLNKAIILIRKKTFHRLSLMCVILFSFTGTAVSDSSVVTKENLRDAILQTQTFTAEQLAEMDVNQDTAVDISDFIFLLQHDIASTLMGDYTGFFVKDNVNKTVGQGVVFGQIPLSLMITGESPLTAVVNRSKTDDGTVEPEYYSLYFPENPPPLVSEISETGTGDYGGLDFTIQFETVSEHLAPDTVLNRKIKFTGQFNNTGRTWISGTYTEAIIGFLDNQGNDVDINLSGKFILIKE